MKPECLRRHERTGNAMAKEYVGTWVKAEVAPEHLEGNSYS